jgi:nitrile hydratase
MYAILRMSLEKGLFSDSELLAKYANASAKFDFESKYEPRFTVGDRVQVRDIFDSDLTAEFWRLALKLPMHVRVPSYIQNKVGFVESYAGKHENAELVAYGIPSQACHLYRVRFKCSDVFDDDGEAYQASDTIDVELLQHWLQKVIDVEDDAEHEEVERHSHVHGGESHVHNRREIVEANAKAIEATSSPYQLLSEIVIDLLCEKKVISRSELTAFIESTDKAIARQEKVGSLGSQIVVKMFRDPAWKQKVMAHPNPLELIQRAFPKHDLVFFELSKVVFLQNTPSIHNVIVCTLCSCYPRQLLGIPPSWYKSAKYRSEIVRSPRQMLKKEFGCDIPSDIAIRVHDSCQELRYMVIPCKTQIPGWATMSDEQLQGKLTRDILIGVKRNATDIITKNRSKL